MENKKYGLGIIGFGGMADYHAKAIIPKDIIDIVGVYDIDSRRCEAAKKRGYKVYDSAEDLLADERIDIVLVATPNNFHKDYSVQAMQAGKAVICEKPVTMNSDELSEIIKVAKEEDKIFTVHQNRRMDKDYLMVKKAVADGILGEVFCIESRVQGARGVPEGWRQYKDVGGGMMLDWGVHLIDQIMMMIPEKVVSVYAHMYSIKYPEVDDNFKLLFKFESGKTAHAEVGTCNFILMPRWYITGDKGTLMIKDWDCEGTVVRAIETEEKWEEEIVYTKAGPTKTMAPRRRETTEEITLKEPHTDYSESYRALVNALEGKGKPLVDPIEAMRVMKVMEAAFLSWETGKEISINV